MTTPSPVMHPVTVACKGPCKRVLYEGDGVDVPSGDGQQILTAFADSSCPVGGQAGGCPNVTPVVEERQEQEPSRLRLLIRAAQARLPRSKSLVLPALVANTPQEIPVTWPTPLADASYAVTIGQEFAAPILLGAIRAAVKAGSRTAAGCTLLVGSTRDVADGTAGLHVVATP